MEIKNFNILVLDDEQHNIDLSKIYIKKFHKSINKIYTANHIEQALELYLEHLPDILLLDIELQNGLTSFHFLEKIPNFKAEVIFITSHKEYAIEAINKMGAISYLVKPIKPTDLINALDKAINSILLKSKATSTEHITHNNLIDFIAIPSTNKIDIINKSDIIYLEADGRYTTFHLINDNAIIASRNIGEYTMQLDTKTFFRIHHKYIINLNMVTSINKSAGNYCELINGKALPIAKRRNEELRRFLKIK